MPRNAGHLAGSETFRNIATYCKKIGVEYLTVYAFSTENWKRPEEEVGGIMKLLDKYLHEAIRDMRKKNIRMKVFGDISRLSPQLQELIAETDKISQTIEGFQANICINYGGRAEIVRAAQALARARSLAGPEGFVLAAGSLYLIGELRTLLRREKEFADVV